MALSTASCYPETCTTAFEMAADLGFDGVEVMVWTDPVSQDPDALRGLSDRFGVPVLAIHAPCLLLTQRVWSTDPWTKLLRAQVAAERVGAGTVVVHPPFRWQREYARGFVDGLHRMQNETDVTFAVENMFPWKARNREVAAYLPHWDLLELDYPATTLDLSHLLGPWNKDFNKPEFDPLWEHSISQLLIDAGALVVISVVLGLIITRLQRA